MGMFFWVSYAFLWLVTVSLIVVVLLVLRQFGMVYLKSASGVSRGGLGIGKRVPDLTLKTVNGEEIALTTLAVRRPLLIFTSPHCAPCRALLPHVSHFTKHHRDVPVVLFSMDATVEETVDFVSGQELNHCIVVSLTNRDFYAEVFEGEVTPFAFLLDEHMGVAAKGLVNDETDLLHVAGLLNQPEVALSAS